MTFGGERAGGVCFNQGDENSGKISERMILGKQNVNCV